MKQALLQIVSYNKNISLYPYLIFAHFTQSSIRIWTCIFQLCRFSWVKVMWHNLCQQMDKKMSKPDMSKLNFMCVFLVVVVHLDSPSNKNIFLKTFFNYHYNFHLNFKSTVIWREGLYMTAVWLFYDRLPDVSSRPATEFTLNRRNAVISRKNAYISKKYVYLDNKFSLWWSVVPVKYNLTAATNISLKRK